MKAARVTPSAGRFRRRGGEGKVGGDAAAWPAAEDRESDEVG